MQSRPLHILAFTLLLSGSCITLGFAAKHVNQRTQMQWNNGVHHSRYRVQQIWHNTETGAKRVGHDFENDAENVGHRLSSEAHHANSQPHKHTH